MTAAHAGDIETGSMGLNRLWRDFGGRMMSISLGARN
jgi:hypothetical protein